MAALAPAGSSAFPTWPVSVSDTDVDSLKQQLSEQETVIAFQGNMLSAVAGQAPAVDREIVKTMDVFQGNQEKQQSVIDSLVEEIKRVNALLVQSEHRLQETEKTHAVYVKQTEAVMAEQRAQIAALDAKFSKEVSDLTKKLEAHIQRFNGHAHLDGYTHHTHYTTHPIN